MADPTPAGAGTLTALTEALTGLRYVPSVVASTSTNLVRTYPCTCPTSYRNYHLPYCRFGERVAETSHAEYQPGAPV